MDSYGIMKAYIHLPNLNINCLIIWLYGSTFIYN